MRRYYYIFNRLIAFCACVFMAVFCFNVTPATCHDVMPVNADLVAEGQPDECFYDIGSWDNFYNPKDLTGEQVRQCLAQGGTLKRNAGYVWGLTSSGDDLWFGTAANIGPVTLDIILATANQEFGLNLSLPPFQIDDILCEMDKSTYMDGELGFLGDYRPPRIFSYNLTSGAITEHTPEDPLLSITFGLRSAGYLNGVAIIAGPVIINDDGVKGINMFAFDTVNKTYLGSYRLRDLKDDNGNIVAEKINNIRKWLEINGVLYTTVGTETGGKVLRWRGSVDDPFRFEVVGDLDDQGTELVYHENHLFILTWPPSGFSSLGFERTSVCDIMMSKNEIPQGGLTAGTEFVSVWNVKDYEPDDVVASSYGLGAAVSYDGYLYWGTMNVPGTSTMLHLLTYPKNALTLQNFMAAFSHTQRSIAIFRGRNFASGHPEIELLYGEEFLSKYQPRAILKKNRWKSVPNNMGQKPLFGKSGFGNIMNVYTWAMAVYNNQLYIGTGSAEIISFDRPGWMDGILRQGNFSLFSRVMDKIRSDASSLSTYQTGFNLYRFPDSQTPAILETNNGFGQTGTYGVRNLLTTDDALYLGTASTSNLDPTGGWALFRITTDGQEE